LSESGSLDEVNGEWLGTKLSGMDEAEDCAVFKPVREASDQQIPKSEIVTTVAEAQAYAKRTGYASIVRPAFTVGRTGGGMCDA
ncbi:carbamoyl-phosphate synthase large subunit, partial [Enterococcus faecalis]|nr:carbamoyl-phosphate synthase large subunit [Enterococcus faecalis]